MAASRIDWLLFENSCKVIKALLEKSGLDKTILDQAMAELNAMIKVCQRNRS